MDENAPCEEILEGVDRVIAAYKASGISVQEIEVSFLNWAKLATALGPKVRYIDMPGTGDQAIMLESTTRVFPRKFMKNDLIAVVDAY